MNTFDSIVNGYKEPFIENRLLEETPKAISEKVSNLIFPKKNTDNFRLTVENISNQPNWFIAEKYTEAKPEEKLLFYSILERLVTSERLNGIKEAIKDEKAWKEKSYTKTPLKIESNNFLNNFNPSRKEVIKEMLGSS